MQRLWGNPEVFHPPIIWIRRADREMFQRLVDKGLADFNRMMREEGEYLDGKEWRKPLRVGDTFRIVMPERWIVTDPPTEMPAERTI